MKRMFLIGLIGMCFTLSAQKNSTLNWFGYIQSAYKYDIVEEGDNSGQFDLLLTCLGLQADINKYSQVFLFIYGDYPAVSGVADSNEFSMREYFGVLDAEVRFKPVKNLQLTFGQFITPFAQEHFKSSSKTEFISRGFVVANSPSYRDLGANISYKNSMATIYGSVTNGSGMNTFDNNKFKNFSAWAEVKPFEGFAVMGGAHLGKDNLANDLAQDVKYYSGGLSYTKGGLALASEASIKDYLDESTTALYAYGLYDIPVETELLKWVTPAVRFDMLDAPGEDNRRDRVTFGVSLGFDKNKWLSMLRVNYELVELQNGSAPDNLVVLFQMRFD